MIASVVGWVMRRSPLELAALAAGLLVFGYAGWDGALWDARWQLVLHLLAIGAIGGLAVLWLRGGALPRTPLDLPILALVCAFAIATLSAMNLGMSLRAMATVTASAAMLPIALVAIRHRPAWVGAVASVPVLLLSIPTLGFLIARRIEWVAVGAPGLPPLRLPAEGTPFGSVAVPPFVIWPAWAAAGLIESPRWRGRIQGGLVTVGIPLTILSGSRSAWLAIAATLLVVAVPWAWRRRARLKIRRPDPRSASIAVVGAAAAAGVALLVVPRLTAVTSLVYRTELWADTLRAWSTDPLLGIGPGFMPYARMAAAPDFSFPVRQPHSHNLPLGVLGDAGLLGLAAAAAVVVSIAWHAGPWRARSTTGRRAGYVLIGLGFGGLFEDLTFVPGFVLLAITVLAIALADADAVRWVRPPEGARRVAVAAAASGAAVALLAGMIVADAGAITYRAGIDAAVRGDWDAAASRLDDSVAIDPWHPAGPKALAVAADHAGRTERAREAAATAVERNPGDAASWTNLALLCAGLADEGCERAALERSVATAPFLDPDLLNAALLFEALGSPTEADDAYRRSLLSQRLTAFVVDWPRPISVGHEPQPNAQAALAQLIGQWAVGDPVDPTAIRDPAVRALAHAVRGERPEAEAWLGRAIDASPEAIATWDVAVVLRTHWGLGIERELAIASAVRGRSFPSPNGGPATPTVTYDIGSFRATPADGFVRGAQRLGTSPPYPWLLLRMLP